MSTAGYKRECEEAAADAATKLEITAQAKLKAVEPEVVAVAPELTIMEQFQEAIIVCRSMDDAIKISPAVLAEVQSKEVKAPIPYSFFGSVRAICADCGWTARMTWSELALEIGQAARRARREELLAGEIMNDFAYSRTTGACERRMRVSAD
jgi:hypothetical protein